MLEDESHHQNNRVDSTILDFELRETFEQSPEKYPDAKEEAISFWRAVRIPVSDDLIVKFLFLYNNLMK